MRLWLIPSMLSLLLLPAALVAVTLGWDQSPGATGYKLYYGTVSRSYGNVIDVGGALSTRATNLTQGARYYFALTAYNEVVGESDYSEELVWTQKLTAPHLSIMPEWVTVDLEGSPVLNRQWTSMASTQLFFRAKVSQ